MFTGIVREFLAGLLALLMCAAPAAQVAPQPAEESSYVQETEIEKIAPARTLSASAGTLSLDVDSPVGSLPKAAKASLSKVSKAKLNKIRTEAAALLGTEIIDAVAFDISFLNNGVEIEPDGKVNITVNFPAIAEAPNYTIIHFRDDGTTEIVPGNVTATSATFEADNFSVYAVVGTDVIVPRITIEFYNYDGTQLIETMYVKDSDTTAEISKIVRDPGAGSVPAGQVFKGWATSTAYTADGLKTIDQVRSDVETLANGLEADLTVKYYAGVFKQFIVKYVDGDGIMLGSHVVETPCRNTDEAYTVNMGYSTDDLHNFDGWLVADGLSNITNPDNATSSTLFPNTTGIRIKGDVKFSVSAPEGHWLVFDENGKGATYNAPRFYQTGENTSSDGMKEMVRNGYTFGGWFKDAACTTGNEFTFGSPITETTTVYAKWTAKARADYTVIIWKQNVAGTGYDFKESVVVKNATVGSTPNVVTTTGNNAGRVTGATYSGETGFSFSSTDQASKTVVPEGNTVVNVYWNRNSYTLTFQTRSGWGWTTIKTITALFGANIRNNFPIVGTNNTTYTGALWQPSGSTIFSNNSYVGYVDTMQAESTTFRLAYNPQNNYTVYHTLYYVEALPGETNTVQFNGKTFSLYYDSVVHYQGTLTSTESEEFTDITGFSKFGSDPAYSNGSASMGSDNTIKLYYTRNVYSINFMDGAYYDGNGNRITSELSNGHISDEGNITYGASLASYNKGGDDYFTPTAPSGYVFECWCIDDACTTPYTFTTMPEGGLTVYARWRQIQYRVFLHPNAETDLTLNWGSESQAMNFRITYNDTISVPTGTRKGYEFFGWYTDVALSHAFTTTTKLNDSTVTTSYDKTVDMTDNMNKWGNIETSSPKPEGTAGPGYNSDAYSYDIDTGEFTERDRFWITKKLDLYAKWSKITIGSDGIGIIYDPNGGSNAPSDTALYKDNTKAIAGAAPKAPANKVFDHWVLQTWNGTAFVDTELTALAGGEFTVDVNKAQIKDNATGEYVALANVIDDNEHSYTYMISLKAVYVDKEVETPTHIAWYSNYGTENDGKGIEYRYDKKDDQGKDTLKINEAVFIYGLGTGEAVPARTNYTFKGWTKTKGGTTADFITWDGEVFKAKDKTGAWVEVTQVAADEKEPIEDLYAVWEELPKFYVYNSGVEGGNILTVYITEDMETYDLTTNPNRTANTLYGGYYLRAGFTVTGAAEDATSFPAYDCTVSTPVWNWNTPQTAVPGTAIQPVAETIYYVKEVSDTYLRNYTHLGLRGGVVTDLVLAAAIDDATYEYAGYYINGTKTSASKFNTVLNLITSDNPNNKYELTVGKISGDSNNKLGYVASMHANMSLVVPGGSITLTPWWETPDHVIVKGVQTRTLSMAEGDSVTIETLSCSDTETQS